MNGGKARSSVVAPGATALGLLLVLAAGALVALPAQEEVGRARPAVPAPAMAPLAPLAPPAAPPTSPLLQPLSPEEAAVFPFVPPLGVLEAVELSQALRTQLVTALEETPINDKRLAQCRRAIDELLLFMIGEDEWRSSLDDYTWYLAGTLTLEGPGPQTMSLRLDPPIDAAQAVALRAEGGRLLVEEIGGRDAEEAELRFTDRALYLRRDVPRRSITYLARPARLRSVQVTLSTDTPGTAEGGGASVVVFVGVSTVPEYGKSAVRLLREARGAIEEFRLREAAESLEAAEREMLAFRRSGRDAAAR